MNLTSEEPLCVSAHMGESAAIKYWLEIRHYE